MTVADRIEQAIAAARRVHANYPARSTTYQLMEKYITHYLEQHGVFASVYTSTADSGVNFHVHVFPLIKDVRVTGVVK